MYTPKQRCTLCILYRTDRWFGRFLVVRSFSGTDRSKKRPVYTLVIAILTNCHVSAGIIKKIAAIYPIQIPVETCQFTSIATTLTCPSFTRLYRECFASRCPGALATLDLRLSAASVCTPTCEIALAENGVVGFSLITQSYLRI